MIFIKLLLFLLLFNNLSSEENFINKKKMQDEYTISNEKKYIGPMGIGLSKSYEVGKDKFCIYNTVEGRLKKKLKNNNLNCPTNLSN